MTMHDPRAGTALNEPAAGDAPPPPTEPARLFDWLLRRYLPGPRDLAFRDGLTEILQVDAAGECLPQPLRVGLTRETRGLVVVGEAGAGKTVLIHRNLARLRNFTPQEGGLPAEVLSVTVPADATLKSLAIEICRATGYANLSSSARKWDSWEAARHRMKMQGIALIWIDEAHHLLRRPGEARDALKTFKSLMQLEGAVALVLSGIPELYAQIRTDRELDRRLCRMALGPVQGATEVQRLRQIVGVYCEKAGLTPPADPHLVERLLFATGGSLGQTVDLFLRGLRRPLFERRPTLQLEDLARAFERKADANAVNPFLVADWAAARLDAKPKEGRG